MLLPSTSEGFGLPVIEALACGATVVVSDIAVLRQVGGDGVVRCPVNDLDAWCDAVVQRRSPVAGPISAVASRRRRGTRGQPTLLPSPRPTPGLSGRA